MKKIISKDGYIYLVEGDIGFETYYNLGKDPDDPMWKEEVKEMNIEKPKKNKKQKKSED